MESKMNFQNKQLLSTIEAQAKFRIAFRDTLHDGKRRYIAQGLSMEVSYPSSISIRVLLHRKRTPLTLADIAFVRKRLEGHGWTLSAQHEGKGFWEGTFA